MTDNTDSDVENHGQFELSHTDIVGPLPALIA